MIRTDLIAGILLVACPAAAAAVSAPAIVVAVPPGPLGAAILALGAQSGVSIGMTAPGLGDLRARGVHGRMPLDRALARLLRGLPARAERIDAEAWRIVPAPPPAAPRRLPQRDPSTEIVVTASKRDTVLSGYAGTAYLLADDGLAGGSASGTEAVLARLPTLASTALGPGRDKLFIRGIADSSFNGPSQATVGEYLGDVRLTYDAPDPDLVLVDVASVEVLEGPQGTLYGAATLGGVLRIVPVAPVRDRWQAAVTGGASATAHGAGGSDVSAVLNAPLGHAAALRVVGYRSVDGGYIDDVGRGLSDVNRTVTTGARATLRVVSGGGWTIDAGGVVQGIDSRDGQYAERDVGRLARSSRLAQPFDNDYALVSLAANRSYGRTVLRVSGGLVAHDLASRFDFSPPAGPLRVFDERDRIRLLSGEISLARRGADGVGWIVGATALHDDERLTRYLGAAAAPAQILGVRNQTTNLSAFGEGDVRLGRDVIATLGLRLDQAHLVGEVLARPAARADEPRRDALAVLPSFALAWRPDARTTLFARYQEGFRPGGLAVAGTDGASVQRFHGDGLTVVEGGMRSRDLLGSGVDGSATLSYARWKNIQADLVDAHGLPFSANIGDGRIVGLEAQLARRIGAGLRAEAAIFLNASRLTDPAAFLMAASDPALPNVAKAGGRAALLLDRPLRGGLALTGNFTARYVGRSRLGVGPALDIAQGGYTDVDATVRVGTAGRGVTLGCTNLADARGDRFGLGDPYDVAARRQVVPLRPRTIRLGLDARF